MCGRGRRIVWQDVLKNLREFHNVMSQKFFVPDEGPLVAMLDDIVAINTENPPGNEQEAAAWVHNRLVRMGCDAEVASVSPGRVNAIGRFHNGPGPTFAFNTHLDVVPAGEGWTTDPFRLRREHDRLYARGACDAKGPLVSMLGAMEQMIAASADWSGTLLGVFVADEEVASTGARHYAKNAEPIDFCVIGEPTSCTAVTAHKGSMRPIVHVHGTTAHSGTPDLGVNAILKLPALLAAIEDEHKRIVGRKHDLVGSPSLTITRISGGHADNVVPDLCELMLDRRMIPGEDEIVVQGEIANLVARASAQAGTLMDVARHQPTTGGASETPLDHPVVAAAQRACRHHHGHDTPVGGFQGGCDLVHFRTVGAQGVVLGPGALEVAHKPDEFVPAGELVLATEIYRDIAFNLLKHA